MADSSDASAPAISNPSAAAATSVHDFTVLDIKGKAVSMRELCEGKVALIVNVASKCGFTPQYAGLQAAYEKFKDRGFVVLGFPCNQFGSQEPGTEADVEEFVCSRFKTTFPMFSKIDVNGGGAHPLWEYLKKEKKGVLGTKGIKWNFTKFLVNQEGQAVHRYASTTTPESIEQDIEKLLDGDKK